MIKYKIYDNGLTLIVSEGGAYSTSFAIMVGTGSVNETEKQNGISHYIEHMAFKGNSKYSATEIADILETCGSNFNAYTSTETTCYYAQTIKESLEKTFDVMTASAFTSLYLEEEAEKEKSVIVEEINMSEDTPEEVCYDLVTRAYFGSDGYGRTILGKQENVENFKREDVLKYLSDYYVSKNVVITFAGGVTLEEADRLVKKYALPVIKNGAPKPTPAHNEICLNNHLYRIKDIEQVHVNLAFPSRSYNDDKRIISETAVGVLGGGMSSRLFRKIREELGLSYSVQAFPSRYKNVGTLGIYAGLNADKYQDGYSAVLEVIKTLKDGGVLESEIEKVKNQLKASTVYTQERPQALCQLYSKYFLFKNEIYDFSARLNDIDLITASKVNEEFDAINFDNFASAVVGKNVKPLK